MNNLGPNPWGSQQNTGNFGQNNFMPQNNYQPAWGRPVYPTLAGKVISSMQDVRPSDIPTDGSPSFFPANDFSCIFMKAWGQDGNIQTVKYIPESQSQQQQSSNEFVAIMSRLDGLEEFMKSNLYKNNSPQQNRKPKEGGNQ